jgi:phosphatidate cytidylyltransferase
VVVGAWLLRRGVSGWPSVPRWVRLALGLTALGIAWLAMAQARLVGINFLLSLLVLVWVADIGAYAFGKSMGRHKLAPTISPGKSWEGVLGGMLCAVALAFMWRWLDTLWEPDSESLYTRLSAHSTTAMLLAVVLLAGMSVVGDLTESLVKRSAGSKDSSRLLPGHGGVLDRIDALLPTLPLSLALLVALGV